MSFCDTYFGKRMRGFLSLEGSELCEHVEADSSLAYAVFVEHSDMGIHDAQVVCKPCHTIAENEQAQSTEYCMDCKKSVVHSKCSLWREWNFNPSEGGEDLYVCEDCEEQPKHKARVARDQKEQDQWYKDEARDASSSTERGSR